MDSSLNEAIILAGGLGSRLIESIGDIPKPLADINGKPFLHHVFVYLVQQDIEKVVLSVGYKWEKIEEVFGDEYLGIKIKYAVEEAPLGTGGAIKLALSKVESNTCFVINGDTFFDADLRMLGTFHQNNAAQCTIAAKSLTNFERYGSMEIKSDYSIAAFHEKQPMAEGTINGGIYCLSRDVLSSFPNFPVFSFEKDYLEKLAGTGKLKAVVFEDYFMDIGVPEDYDQFKKDMKAADLSQLNIDKSWTLFLDRDGVINERLIDDYVKQLNELRILDGVPEAIKSFGEEFGRIVVVTNQQGIGKGMMDENDLEIVHGYMNNVFNDHGGNIDKFYFAPQLASEGSNYRKPGTGMGLHAKEDFPEIDFSKSLMIGDSESDIEFGIKLGMKTVMLTTVSNVSTKADYIFNNLHRVAEAIKNY